jgi:hypothetical protein
VNLLKRDEDPRELVDESTKQNRPITNGNDSDDEDGRIAEI